MKVNLSTFKASATRVALLPILLVLTSAASAVPPTGRAPALAENPATTGGRTIQEAVPLATSEGPIQSPADAMLAAAGHLVGLPPDAIGAVQERQNSVSSLTGTNGVSLGGTLSWQLSGFNLDLRAGSLCNNGTENPTGTLRVELWAFSSPFFNGEVGYKLGQSANLSGLAPGFCYNNYDTGTVPLLTIPPDGIYYVVMFLDEFTGSSGNNGFSYDDFLQFSRTITVSGGVISNTPSGCTPSSTTLCIDDQVGDRRFQIRAAFATSQGAGASGNGQAIQLSSLGVPHGGLLWFFSADNPELLIKILPACGVNGRHWVFASAGTNVGLTLTVTDMSTGAQVVYTNQDVHPMTPIQDTNAFLCP